MTYGPLMVNMSDFWQHLPSDPIPVKRRMAAPSIRNEVSFAALILIDTGIRFSFLIPNLFMTFIPAMQDWHLVSAMTFNVVQRTSFPMWLNPSVS